MVIYGTIVLYFRIYLTVILFGGASCKSHLHNLFILQKHVIRMVCKLPYLAPSSSSFTKLKLLTIEQINRYQILLFMYRFHHQLLPSSMPFNLQKVQTQGFFCDGTRRYGVLALFFQSKEKRYFVMYIIKKYVISG